MVTHGNAFANQSDRLQVLELQWSHEWLRMEIWTSWQVCKVNYFCFNGAMSGYAWKYSIVIFIISPSLRFNGAMSGYAWKYGLGAGTVAHVTKLQWSHEWLRMEMMVFSFLPGMKYKLQWSHEWLRMEIWGIRSTTRPTPDGFNGAMSGYAWKYIHWRFHTPRF